jgi:bifunctional DNA-binding transcriptional regulator/antitoxin component of YhaV-PrlF toxin-antitoxin module
VVITSLSLLPVVFKVKLGKTGHSLKVTLPRPIIDGFGWKEGDEILLLVSDNDIVLKKKASAA